MATPQNSGNTPARPNENNRDEELEAAVREAGQHPELIEELANKHRVGEGVWFNADELAELRGAAIAAGLDSTEAPVVAKLLGVGAGMPLVPGALTSPLRLALEGFTLPPPGLGGDEWYERIPEGAFDAGVARVMAFMDVDQVAPEREGRVFVSSVMRQVEASYSFARFVSLIVACFRDGLSTETIVEEVTQSAAVAFVAGHVMGQEAADIARATRVALARVGGKGTTEDLVQLLLTKIHPGAVDPEAVTSRDYWTLEQFKEASAHVRMIEHPEEQAALAAAEAAENGGAR